MAAYENDGTGNFKDVTEALGLKLSLYGTGIATGDYDGDGFTDLYITALGHNRLFRNLGGKRFEDVTAAMNVAGDAGDYSGPAPASLMRMATATSISLWEATRSGTKRCTPVSQVIPGIGRVCRSENGPTSSKGSLAGLSQRWRGWHRADRPFERSEHLVNLLVRTWALTLVIWRTA